MPKPAFFRRLPAAERAAFDTEIRRRGYGDLEGLVGWLADRGFSIGKSAVWQYARHLRWADESSAPPVDFSAETQAAILECAGLILRLGNSLRRIEAALELQGIQDERDPNPE